MIPPLLALFAWIPVSLFFFWRYPFRVAILINFVGGWALLPTAAFVATPVLFPYWILGTCLPSNYFFTKETVTGISGLLGILLFYRRSCDRLRLSIWDLPMLAWCIVPIFSAVANELSIGVSLRCGLYQLLAWGVPYLVCRL